MIFNFWRKYPRRKPKKSGMYQCLARDAEDTEKMANKGGIEECSI